MAKKANPTTKRKPQAKSPRTSKLNSEHKIGVWLTRSKRLEIRWQLSTTKKLKPKAVKKTKKRPKAKKRRSFVISPFLRQVVLPLFFLLTGLGGMWYFGSQIGQVQGSDLGETKTFESQTVQVPTPTPDLPKNLPRSEPTRISVPSVGIDYPVISVGREADGTMQVPAPLDPLTGWYKYSPTPGEIGPSVIVGHVDNLKGPSVFWRLRDIKAGDHIEVTRTDGKTVKFKVDALKEFDQQNFPTEEVYGNIDHAGLRLITCGGTFDRSTGHYTANTVVFASLIVEPVASSAGQ